MKRVETIDTERLGKLAILMHCAMEMVNESAREAEADGDEELCEKLGELWGDAICFQMLFNRLRWGQVDIKFDIEVPEAEEAEEDSCGCIWKVCTCNKEEE